jgi:beta-glucuronidase
MVRDFQIMKWQGANSFRTSHYPYAEEVYDLADRMGFLIIDETPAVGLSVSRRGMFAQMLSRLSGGPELPEYTFSDEGLGAESRAELCRVVERLIQRDKNHPSVIMWSIANEPDAHEEGATAYFQAAVNTARQADPARPVTIVERMGYRPNESKVAPMVDVVCLNRYYGWYVGTGEIERMMPLFEQELSAYRELFGKPVIVTEFGADTVEGNHSLPPTAWSEEYQVEYYRRNCELFDRLDFVVGEHAWNFADFLTTESIIRVRGNRKGLFTRDRQPKMAAHFLRERWRGLSKHG